MELLRQYIISLVAAAIVCSCITAIPQKGTNKELLKLLCGVFLALTIIKPVLWHNISEWEDFGFLNTQEANEAALLGKNIAQEQYADIIKAETEAYILDKAAAMNAKIKVEVTLQDSTSPIPVGVHLTGKITPKIKMQLESLIENDLGITRENQKWTG